MVNVAEAFVTLRPDTKGFGAEASRGISSALGGIAGVAAKALAGVTAIGAVGFGAAVKQAANFESSLNLLQAVSSATGDEMQRMSALAKQLGADTSLPATSAKDAADAMLELSKAGLSVTDTMGAARGVLQLSAAGAISNARAAEITANALNSFGLAGTEAVRVADLLAAAANASSVEVTDLADAFQMSSAVFSSAHIPVEDLTAAISLLGNAGIKGSDAGTSLKQMILSLQTPSQLQKKTMKELGFSIYDAAGNMFDMRTIIERLQKAMGPLTQQQRDFALGTIFGSDAVRAGNVLLAKGVEGFDAMKVAVTKQGAAADLAAARMKGLNGAIESIKSSIQTVAITIGSFFLPVLAKLGRGIAQAISDLDPIIANIQWLVANRGSLADIVPEGTQATVWQRLAFAISRVILAVRDFLPRALRTAQALFRSIQPDLIRFARAVQRIVPTVIDIVRQIVILAQRTGALNIAWKAFATTAILAAQALGEVLRILDRFLIAINNGDRAARAMGASLAGLAGGTLVLLALNAAAGKVLATAKALSTTFRTLNAVINPMAGNTRALAVALGRAAAVSFRALRTSVGAAYDAVVLLRDAVAGIVSKTVTITQSIIRTGAALIENLANAVQTITQNVVRTGDALITDLADKTVQITAVVKAPADLKVLGINFGTSLSSGLVQGLGVGLGLRLTPVLIAAFAPAIAAAVIAAPIVLIGTAIAAVLTAAILRPDVAGKVAGAFAAMFFNVFTLPFLGIAKLSETLGKSVIAAIRTLPGLVATAVSEAFRAIFEIGSGVAIEIIGKLPLRLIDSFQKAMSTFASDGARALSLAIRGEWGRAVESALNALKAVFLQLPLDVSMDFAKSFKNIGVIIAKAVAGWVVGVAPEAKNVALSILKPFDDLIPDVGIDMGKVKDAISTGLATILPLVRSWGATFVANFVDTFLRSTQTARTGMAELVATVSEKLSELLGFFKALPGQIVDALASLPGLVRTAVVDGLNAGIDAIGRMAGDFYNWGYNLGKKTALGILDGIKDFIGNITSFLNPFDSPPGFHEMPSMYNRFGQTLGEQLGEGMADGVRAPLQTVADLIASLPNIGDFGPKKPFQTPQDVMTTMAIGDRLKRPLQTVQDFIGTMALANTIRPFQSVQDIIGTTATVQAAQGTAADYSINANVNFSGPTLEEQRTQFHRWVDDLFRRRRTETLRSGASINYSMG